MKFVPKFGYCGMTADYLHIGHINFLKAAARNCQKLIVGVMTDDSVVQYKKSRTIMNQYDRAEIVKSIRYVYSVVFQNSFEYPHTILRLKDFYDEDFVIIDSDDHKRGGADIILPYSQGISSSMLKRWLSENPDIS